MSRTTDTPQNIKKAKEEIARLDEEATAANTNGKRATDAAKKPAHESEINGNAEAEL